MSWGLVVPELAMLKYSTLEDVVGNPALLDVVYRVVNIQCGKEKLAKGRCIELGLAFMRHTKK